MAVINSIQQGIAGSLDFQGIVDLVGDKLREVFGTGDIGIAWIDYEARHFHNIYAYEHGERLYVDPYPLEERHTTRRGPLVYNTPPSRSRRAVPPWPARTRASPT
jgi:hypothetical protein